MRWLAIVSIIALPVALTTRAGQPPQKKEAPVNAYDYIGRIEAPSAEIRPRVTGILEKLLVKDGADVKQGDILAEIDPRQYLADTEVARAKVAVAEATSKAAAATLARTKSAFSRGILSRDDMTQSEAEQGRADAMVRAARAELQLAELNLTWTKVQAPIDGRAGRFTSNPGNLLTAGGPPLVTLVATGTLYVVFDVSESTMLKLRREGVGEPSKLSAAVGLSDEAGYPRPVTIDFIDPQFNASTGTVRVRGTMANPSGLMSPGMTVRVRLKAAGN